MRASTRMTLAAGWAAALGAVPLDAVFSSWRWLWFTWAAVAAVVAAHLLARSLRLPAALVPATGGLGLLVYLTVVFAGHDAFLGLVPTFGSLRALRDGVQSGLVDVHDLAAPVPPTPGLVIITAGSVGLLTIVLDLVAVVLRRPAAAGLALLGLYAVPTAVASDGVPWPLFVVGAVGYLVLLMAEGRDRLVRWGRPVSAGAGETDEAEQSEDDDTPLPLTGQRIGAAALAIAVIAPLFVPGLTANALSELARTGSGNGTGYGGPLSKIAINPWTTLSGELNQPVPHVLFKVQSSKPDFYFLRTMVLEDYRASGWVRRSASPNGNDAVGRLERPSEQVDATGGAYTLTIDVDRVYNGDSLPTLYYATFIDGVTTDWNYYGDTAVLRNPSARANSQHYRIEGIDALPSAADLETAGAPSPDSLVSRNYGSADNVPDEVRRTVQQIVANARATTPYEKARAIYDYFRGPDSAFTYSTQTGPKGNSGSALVDFLRQKQGFCEQYASAMGVMLRVAGIPSRVVIGFTHEKRENDTTWDVMTSDAHAWAEGYFQGVGWAPFNPTPLSDGRGIDTSYAPALPTTAGPTASTSSGAANPKASGPSGRLDPDIQNTRPNADGHGLVTPRIAVGGLTLLVLVALLFAPAVSRLLTRRQRMRSAGGAESRTAGHAAWDEALSTAMDIGVSVPPTETPRGTARRLVRELSFDAPAAAGLRLLALAEERARYAREAGVDGDLPTAVRAVRRGLRVTATRGERLRANAFPPSTVRAAVRAMARGSGNASTAASRLAAALRQALDPRRKLTPRRSASR